MKKVLLTVVILLSILISGCFSENRKNSEEKIESANDVITSILEITKQQSLRATADQVPNVSNGVISGVYLKLSTGYYTYSFKSLSILNLTEKNNFIDYWNNAEDSESYIIYGEKAIDLINAKDNISKHSSLGNEIVNNGLVATTLVIQSDTLTAVFPDEIIDPQVRVDRKVSLNSVVHTTGSTKRKITGTTFKNATVIFSENGSTWSAIADSTGYFNCQIGDPQGNIKETLSVMAGRADIDTNISKTFYLYSMRVNYDVGMGNTMYFTGSIPQLTSWGNGLIGTWTTGNIWISSFFTENPVTFEWKTRKNLGGSWENNPNHTETNLTPSFNGGY